MSKTIRYNGRAGSHVHNELSGYWSAPDAEQDEQSKNVREVDDEVAANHVGSGLFEYVTGAATAPVTTHGDDPEN